MDIYDALARRLSIPDIIEAKVRHASEYRNPFGAKPIPPVITGCRDMPSSLPVMPRRSLRKRRIRDVNCTASEPIFCVTEKSAELSSDNVETRSLSSES
jgi:hypothetical protein